MTKQGNKVTNVTEDVIPVEVNKELENEVVKETSSTEYESTEESIERLENFLNKEEVENTNLGTDEIVEEILEKQVKEELPIKEELEVFPEEIMPEGIGEITDEDVKEELPIVSEPKGEDFPGILINSTPQYSIYSMK
jgi:hypothetical protein